MDESAFAVDFFDTALWDKKLEFIRKTGKGFFWGIFNGCIEQHESLRVFLFTLRQLRKLLSIAGPSDIEDIKIGLQRIVKIETGDKRFIKNIIPRLYCIIILDDLDRKDESGKKKIIVKKMIQEEGSNKYFLNNDLFKDYIDNEDLYIDIDMDEFLRQELRNKINVPKSSRWLYYFTSQKRPNDQGRGIIYCPDKTVVCPWNDFFNEYKGLPISSMNS